MKLYVDDVNIEKIKELSDLYPIDGVTSNPTILKRYGKQPFEILTAIRKLIGPDADLMTQVVSTDAEGMIAETHRIAEVLGKEHTYIKVPANPQGIKAIKTLSKEGYWMNATAIYTVIQGFLAAQAGAKALAPYVSRIDNLNGDGLQVTKDLQDVLRANGLDTRIVAASFKTTKQVVELAQYGVYGAAINVAVWEGFMKNEVVTAAVQNFNHDFATLCGEGKTFLDLSIPE